MEVGFNFDSYNSKCHYVGQAPEHAKDVLEVEVIGCKKMEIQLTYADILQLLTPKKENSS